MDERTETKQHTVPSKATRAAEATEARLTPSGGPEPTSEEAAAADAASPDPDVAAHEREMQHLGVNQKGEGRVP